MYHLFYDSMPNGWYRLNMSSQPLPIDESVIATLKVRRDELIKEATAVRVDVVFLFANG